MRFNKEELKGIYKNLIVVFGGILFYYFLVHFQEINDAVTRYISYTRPIIFGLAIAFVSNMLMNLFENTFRKYTKLKSEKIRIISMIFSFLTLITIVAFFLSVILPRFISSVINLLYQLPNLINNTVDRLESLPLSEKIIEKIHEFVKDIQINNLINRLVNLVLSQGGFMLQGTMSVVGNIFSSFFEAFLAISFSIYILTGKDSIKRNIKKVTYSFIPEHVADSIIYHAVLLYRNFYNFFTGQFLEAMLLGIVVFVGITLIGAPYALILGVTSGLLNVIPYIGAIIGALISVVLISITDPIKGIIYLVFIVIYQQFDGNYIYPKLVGGKIGIPALWIMAAITIGGAVKGVIGMVLFVPIFATIYMVLRDFSNRKLKEKNINIDRK